MIFLATPHRGSDLAATLSNILRVSLGSRQYISDLEPSSDTLNRINDAFRHYQNDLIFCSFYETQETTLGPGSSALIVRKDSATLGYPGENIALLNANHRSICKFDTPTDSNYLTLLDCFNTINRAIMKKSKNIQNSKAELIVFLVFRLIKRLKETSIPSLSLSGLHHQRLTFFSIDAGRREIPVRNAEDRELPWYARYSYR
jgi:hypothetical protein